MIQKKVCVLGSFGVGKTSLVRRYVQSIFSDTYLTTVGVKVEKRRSVSEPRKSRWCCGTSRGRTTSTRFA